MAPIKAFLNRFILALILLQLMSSQTAQDYQIFKSFRPYLPPTSAHADEGVQRISNATSQSMSTSQSEGAADKNIKSNTNTTNVSEALSQYDTDSLDRYYQESLAANEKEQTLKNDEKKIAQELKNDKSLQSIFNSNNGQQSGNSRKGATSSTSTSQGGNNKENPKLTLDSGHEYCKSGAKSTCSSCDGLKGESKANCIQGLQETYFDIEKQISKIGLKGEGVVYLIFMASALNEAKIDLVCPVANDAPTAKLLEKMGKMWFSAEVSINKTLRNEMTKLKTYLRKLTKKEKKDSKKLNETAEQKREREQNEEVQKIIEQNSAKKSPSKKVIEEDIENAKSKNQKVERDSLENIKKYYALMIIAYKKVVKAIEQKQTLLRTLFSFYYVVFVLGFVEVVVQLLLWIVIALLGAVIAVVVFIVCLVIAIVFILVGTLLFETGVGLAVCWIIGIVIYVVGIILAVIVGGIAAYLIWRIYLYYSPIFPGCISGGLDSQIALGMLAIEYCGKVKIPLSDFIGTIANMKDFIPLLNTLFGMIEGILDKIIELLIPGWKTPLSEIPKHVKAWREVFDAMLMEKKPRCVFCASQAMAIFPITATFLTSHVTRSILAVVQSVFAIILSEVFLEAKRKEAKKRIKVLRKILGYLSRLEELEKEESKTSEAGQKYNFKIEKSETNSDDIEAFVKQIENEYENEMGSSALSGSERVCMCNGTIDHGCKIPPKQCSENTRKPNIDGLSKVDAKIPKGYKTNFNTYQLQADQEYKALTSGNMPSNDVLLERAGKRISAAYKLKKQAGEHFEAIKNSKLIKDSYQIQYHSKRFEQELGKLKDAFPRIVDKIDNKHVQDAFGGMGFLSTKEIKDEDLEKRMKDNIYDRIGEDAQNSLKDLFDSLSTDTTFNSDMGNTGSTNFGVGNNNFDKQPTNNDGPDFSKIMGKKNFGIAPKDDISLWKKITNRYHRKFIEWVKEGHFKN